MDLHDGTGNVRGEGIQFMRGDNDSLNGPSLQAQLQAARRREVRHAEALEALRAEKSRLEARLLQYEARQPAAAAPATGHPAAPPDSGAQALRRELEELREDTREGVRACEAECDRMRRQLLVLGQREGRRAGWESDALLLFYFAQRQAALRNTQQLLFLTEGLSAEVRLMIHSVQMRIALLWLRLPPLKKRYCNQPQQWREFLQRRNKAYGQWKHAYTQRLKNGVPKELRVEALDAVASGQSLNKARGSALVSELRRETKELRQDVDYLLKSFEELHAFSVQVRGSLLFRLGELSGAQLVKLKLRPKNALYLQRIDGYHRAFMAFAPAYRADKFTEALDPPALPQTIPY